MASSTSNNSQNALNNYLGLSGGTFGGGGGDPLGPTYTFGDDSAQSNFNQAMNAALLAEGINPAQLTPAQQQQLQTIIAGSPYLASLQTTSGQQAIQSAGSAYGGNVITYLEQQIASTFFPQVSSSTGLSQSNDPNAASFGLQLKSQISGIPQTTQALYQEELLQMGLPSDLYTTYAGAVDAWEKYFSGPPDPQQLVQLLGIQLPSGGSSQVTGQGLQGIQQQAQASLYGNLDPTVQSGQGKQGAAQQGSGGGFAAGTQQQYDQAIQNAANATGVPSQILSALLIQESGDNPNAVSSSGAEGIAQFMPGTAAGMGLTDPFNATDAIMAAARLLASNFKEFGNWAEALAAYNAGGGAVQAEGVNAEQDSYAQNILSMAEQAGYSGGQGTINPNGGSYSGSAGIQQATTPGAQISLPNPASITQAGMEDKIRQMPSNIPGLNMGQYSDIQQTANSVMQSLVGHSASDGVIASVAASGYQDTPSLVQSYLGSMTTGALDAMGSEVYNNIYAANQSTLQNVYNEQGFDPSLALQQYQQYYQQHPPGVSPGAAQGGNQGAPAGSEGATGKRAGTGPS